MSKNFSDWSCNTRGKEIYELGHNDLRRWYQRDIDQIVHSTAFRKLQRKTQLLSEKDPRVRSRLIHTLEVSRIAVEISEKLGLNKELTEAICMGHDLGTSPYGFVGNQFLSKKAPDKLFSHEVAGCHMLETLAIKKISPDNEDLLGKAAYEFTEDPSTNRKLIEIDKFPYKLMVSRKWNGDERKYDYYTYHISQEVLDGVICHGELGIPQTLEAQVVKFSDNIAYLSQDIDDLVYSGILEISNFIEHCAPKVLKFNEHGKERSMRWKDIDKGFSKSLKKALKKSRGQRIAAFITRFVDHNMSMVHKDGMEKNYSDILEMEIPMLECDKGLEFVIDFIWAFIGSFYSDTLIQTSNKIQESKINQLWNILDYSPFYEENKFYQNFIDSLNDSRFGAYDMEWKKAYFMSHLAWDEVDNIITSFHQRDFTFELDIQENGNENC